MAPDRHPSERKDHGQHPNGQVGLLGRAVGTTHFTPSPSGTIRTKAIDVMIASVERYLEELIVVEKAFMQPLRAARPPVIPLAELNSFTEVVFRNILEIQGLTRRLVEALKKTSASISGTIGDLFLKASADIRIAYSNYMEDSYAAEKRLRDELNHNDKFNEFAKQCSRDAGLQHEGLSYLLKRPDEQLHAYPVFLESIRKHTTEGSPDAFLLRDAIQLLEKLQFHTQLVKFQKSMGQWQGRMGSLQWSDLVSDEVRNSMAKQEQLRQSIIFELIQSETSYVLDLENLKTLYIRPLQTADVAIIPQDHLPSFIHDVFHNYTEILSHHRTLLARFHEIQRKEHPMVGSILTPLLEAAQRWQDAYVEYTPNYPIAEYRFERMMEENSRFSSFATMMSEHYDSHRLNLKNFLLRPVTRISQYDSLLASLLRNTPVEHRDMVVIPQLRGVLKDQIKATDAELEKTRQKVEIWRYELSLVFEVAFKDLDLFNEDRRLILAGKMYRLIGKFNLTRWIESIVFLFDNYLILTTPKRMDENIRYLVDRSPIPLDLIDYNRFVTSCQLRRGQNSLRQDQVLNTLTLDFKGRIEEPLKMYAESETSLEEWEEKLTGALLNCSSPKHMKAFEVNALSAPETFPVGDLPGRVTCSVPLSSSDGREMVAIGCLNGVWFGYRHDPQSMRRVLYLKMVTQMAMMDGLGIFVVLADKVLFAYDIEALVPSSSSANVSAIRVPQKVSGNRDVQFFAIGTFGDRTVIIYMKKRGSDSVLRIFEPVTRVREMPGYSAVDVRVKPKGNWLKRVQDLIIPGNVRGISFVDDKLAVLAAKGVEMINAADLNLALMPVLEDPQLNSLIQRCRTSEIVGIFRSSSERLLLCYDKFGLHLDNSGVPSSSIAIEWTGTAIRAAWHPFYVLLFNYSFVEVRHIQSGKLVQVVQGGSDIRCTWSDPNPAIPPIVSLGPGGQVVAGSREARVHIAMSPDESESSQQVFELIPRLPDYVNDDYYSPSSPSTPTLVFPSSPSPASPSSQSDFFK